MKTEEEDALLLLRQSIASRGEIVPTGSADPASTSSPVSLSDATHLHFSQPTAALQIETRTRFETGAGSPVNLRSIYFAWLNREVAIPEYNDAVDRLNEALQDKGASAQVHPLAFVQRLDLITWLEGASEESEYIRPLPGGAAGAGFPASGSAAPASGQTASTTTGRVVARAAIDPRLAQIYQAERKTGDRNTVLRGIKATDFSHVRKMAAAFLIKRPLPSGTKDPTSGILSLQQKPSRRPDPIILLSPSASSILRMTNARAFLEEGRYEPPDTSASSAPMLHISRIVKDLDPVRPMRFILVEGPEQFKPDYWNRVVAVFTTGQAWQFKSYRWNNPTELFRHVLGVYLGWRNEKMPEAIKGYGHGVMSVSVEKWRDPSLPGVEATRWRDREVVESIWKAVETSMRNRGWRKDAAPSSI